jgi:hypothetical protein
MSSNKLFRQIQLGELGLSDEMMREWNGVYRETFMRSSLTEILAGTCAPPGEMQAGDLCDMVLESITRADAEKIGGHDIMEFHEWLHAAGPSRVREIAKAASRETSELRLLLYFKMLEEMSLNFEKESSWRVVMMEIAKPLIPGITMVKYHESSEKIATLCLERIIIVEKRKQTPSQEKIKLAGQILGEALFHYSDPHACAMAVDALARENKEASIAPLLALSAFLRRHEAHPNARMLLEMNFSGFHPLLYGDNASLPLLSRGITPPRVWVVEEVCRHMNGLFDPTNVVTPHPLFLATDGYPLPRLPKEGLHENAFRALGAINASEAFVAMIDGVTDLVLPHMDGERTPRQIKTAIPTIAESLTESGKRLGVPGAEEFVRLFLSHPEPKKLIDLPEGKLSEVVPFAAHILLRGTLFVGGMGEKRRSRIMAENILLADMALEGGSTENLSLERVAGRLLERHSEVFNGHGVEDLRDPNNFREALKAFARKTVLSGSSLHALPERTPKPLNVRNARR